MEVEPLVLRLADRSVSGVVVDEQDRPVSKASISCYGPDQPWRHVMADDQGRFKVEGICAGSIEIRADIRDLSGSVRTQADAQDVRIVLNLSRRDGSVSKPVSLLGGQLPDMKAFGMPIADVNAVGKPLVICFFDMNQRPSRNCIVQLAKTGGRTQTRGRDGRRDPSRRDGHRRSGTMAQGPGHRHPRRVDQGGRQEDDSSLGRPVPAMADPDGCPTCRPCGRVPVNDIDNKVTTVK